MGKIAYASRFLVCARLTICMGRARMRKKQRKRSKGTGRE